MDIFIILKMVNFENLDKGELQKLIIGAASILAIYCVSGVIHEYLYICFYNKNCLPIR